MHTRAHEPSLPNTHTHTHVHTLHLLAQTLMYTHFDLLGDKGGNGATGGGTGGDGAMKWHW